MGIDGKTKTPLKVIVVGAGLGGLATAIALQKTGHSVTVVEQAAVLGEVGAGIQIPPNSAKIIRKLGLGEEFEKYIVLPENLYFRSYKDGKVLSTQNLNPMTLEKYNGPFWQIHRADFHRVLVEGAERLGIKIELGQRITDVDFENAIVTSATGNKYSGDLIVGADGLRSVTRTLFLGNANLAYNTGDLAYRMLIRCSEMRKYPELKFLFEKPQLNFWLGPHMHCVVYLLNGGEVCNVVVLQPDNLPPDVNIQPATPEELQSIFVGWDPAFKRLMSLVESTAKWRLQNSRELDTWVHPAGKFALLGDSCHATLPYLAQGAAQAVEDAGVLASLLVELEDKSQLHDMLKIYENLRKSRTTRVVQGSSYIGQKVFHLVDGPEQQKRDEDLTKPPFVGYPNRWSDPLFQKFLFKYDPEEEAARGLADFKAGRPIKGYMEDEIITPNL